MPSMVAVVLLLLAFGVLVGTFVWIAHLLAEREQEKKRKARARKRKAARAEVEDEEEPAEEEENGAEPETEEPEPPETVRGRGYGSNYGLLLGALSCGLFWMSPLVMALSFVGGFYCARAIVNGVRYFRVVIWRAVAGMALCFAGIALQLMSALGVIPALV